MFLFFVHLFLPHCSVFLWKTDLRTVFTLVMFSQWRHSNYIYAETYRIPGGNPNNAKICWNQDLSLSACQQFWRMFLSGVQVRPREMLRVRTLRQRWHWPSLMSIIFWRMSSSWWCPQRDGKEFDVEMSESKDVSNSLMMRTWMLTSRRLSMIRRRF